MKKINHTPQVPRGAEIKICLCAFVLLSLSGFSLSASADNHTEAHDSLLRHFESDGPPLPGDDATLNDYLNFGAWRSPRVRASFSRWQAEVSRAGHISGLADPSLSYAYFVEPIETRLGPQRQRIQVRQSFPWFGTLGAKKEAQSAQARAAAEMLETELLSLKQRITSVYAELYYLGRELQFTQESSELLELWESTARSRYRVSLADHPDVIRSEMQRARLEDRLLELEAHLEPLKTKLRALVVLPTDTDVPIPTELPISTMTADADSLFAWMEASSPVLAAYRERQLGAMAQERAVSKSALPSFAVGVDYFDIQNSANPISPNDGRDAWALGVSVNIPLWFGKTGNRKSEASAVKRAAAYALEDQQLNLMAHLKRLQVDYEDARRRHAFYRDGLLPKAEQWLGAMYAAYRSGETDFLSLLDSQEQLLQLQQTAERAKADAVIHLAALESLVGRSLTQGGDSHE